MNKEEMKYLEAQQGSMEAMQQHMQQQQMMQQQQDIFLQDNDKSIVSEQLDVEKEMEEIEHLLRGFIKKDGQWVDTKNENLKVFTEYGIQYILWFVRWYLNKNTLLSNYDDETILQKMEDLSVTFADDIFMEYDKMFKYPSFEECKQELNDRIANKVQIRKYALSLMGQEVTDEELTKQFFNEMEGRIERELMQIKEQKMKNKLKRYESITRVIQDKIHSAYQRAWKGQERGTLRQHTHISETRGNGFAFGNQNQLNPSSWFKRNK